MSICLQIVGSQHYKIPAVYKADIIPSKIPRDRLDKAEISFVSVKQQSLNQSILLNMYKVCWLLNAQWQMFDAYSARR